MTHPCSQTLILFLSLLPRLYSQQAGTWRDQSPHAVQFIPVDGNVRLEVLDWGGHGRPVVLLAGGGNTAHVFDDFAPKLTPEYHVYGLTRRGFGASGVSSSDNSADRLGEDILAVIDALRLNRPVLVGHSIAGWELSWIGRSYADRVAGLVYLEAGYPYAFYDGKGPTMKEFQEIKGPQPPSPSGFDLATFTALQNWNETVFGFRMPVAELRQIWTSTYEGRPAKFRDSPGSQALMTIMTTTKQMAEMPAPALMVFAIPHLPETWIDKAQDAGVRRVAETYFAKLDALSERQAELVAGRVRIARVVRLPGAHYVFLSNEADVLLKMRAFLAGLK